MVSEIDAKTIVEAQAQLVYQTIGFRNGWDTVANVQFQDVNSLAGRLGIRLMRTWELDDSDKEKRLTAWLCPNIWHEFQGVPQTTFASDAPGDVVREFELRCRLQWRSLRLQRQDRPPHGMVIASRFTDA